MSVEKTFWVEDGLLFCNTIFAAKGVSKEIPFEDLEEHQLDFTKSFYEFSFIYGANPAERKGLTTIRVKDGESYVVAIPFSEFMALRKAHARG